MEINNKYKMITKENLLEIGKKKDLSNKEYIEKNYFQDVFLFHLFKKTNELVFKGGTALYKFYRLPRFSEDLNFSVTKKISLDKIQKIIEKTIQNIDYFEIKSIRNLRDSLLIKLGCKGILTMYHILRIDINFKNEIIEGFDVKNYISDYIDINPFSLRILKPEEIIAEKIHSIFNREKARDLFDLFFLLRRFDFDKELVIKKLKIFNINYDKNVLIKRINNLKSIWEKELRAFVLIELPDFEIVKNYLKNKIS